MKEWRNRIVGHGEAPPEELLPNPLNWRAHPDSQRAAMSGVLGEVGWVQQVIRNRTTGRLIDGHLRVELARGRGVLVPFVEVELTEDEERLVLATLDPLASMARPDDKTLDMLLATITAQDADVQALIENISARFKGMTIDDRLKEWEGMPEFKSEDALGITIAVHFANEADIAAFSVLVGQPVNAKTKTIWYPEVPRLEANSRRVVTDDA